MLIKKIAKAKVSLATINNPTIYCVNIGLGDLDLLLVKQSKSRLICCFKASCIICPRWLVFLIEKSE